VEQVSFGLAPRLNAAGRIAHASKGVELMISTSWEDARRRAEELCAINVERQTIERTIHEQALDRLHEIGADQDQVIVLDGKDWNPGVIGIVASRILEIYNRPVLMITVHDGKGKGSCRSIPAFDIFKALQHCSDLLIQMGGHKMAAGFSIEPDKIPAFRKKINEYASRILKPEDFIPVLEIEDILDLDVLDIPFVRDLGVLEPCGADNPRPLFASRHLKVEYARRIGKDQKHFKCLLRQGGYSVDGVFWNPGDSLSCRSHDMVSVVYRPEIHEWHGEHVQMNLKDIYEEDTPLSLDRDMLVTAFVKLRDIVPVRRPVQDVKADMEKALHGIFNEKEVHLMLRVFEEISLLKKVTEGTGEYYEYHRAAHKLNLESSRTYCKYRQ
jgi:single-stranded-DNA-specific exonuclease